MGEYSEKMERTRVVRIAVADKSVKALSVGQPAGTMMSGRSSEHLFIMAGGSHGVIPDAKALTPVAGPIAPKAKVYLTGASVDPDRLIAGQRARRPVHRVTCDVLSGMQDEPAAAVWHRWDNLRLIPNNVGTVMMLSRFIGVGKSVTCTEQENGGKREHCLNKHVLSFASQALSVENAAGVCPE